MCKSKFKLKEIIRKKNEEKKRNREGERENKIKHIHNKWLEYYYF